jgi:hypothetical protein
MRRVTRAAIGALLRRFEGGRLAPDLAESPDREIHEAVRPFTMTSRERLAALTDAVRYIERYEIPGAIVECGVWRGGSMMAAALTLRALGRCDRALHLFDTFDGMPAPTARDRKLSGELAGAQFERRKHEDGGGSDWCNASLEEVRRNVESSGYPRELVHYHQGRVEDTIPEHAPACIALLRLDTDWYASTRHELCHLFPRLSPGGVLIVDDYGAWRGARQAVDEFLAESKMPLLLGRIDYTGRIAVKPFDGRRA